MNSDSLEKCKQLWYGYVIVRWSHFMVLIKVNLADKKCSSDRNAKRSTLPTYINDSWNKYR